MIATRAHLLKLAFPLALAVFVVAGCEGEHWVKPGSTTADLRRDLADCERVATGPTPFHFWALGLSYERARDWVPERKGACLAGRGWVPAAE